MVAATAVAGPALFVVGVFLIPGTSSDTPVPFDNPFGQPGLVGTVAKGLALHAASLPAALVCVILRFRASRGVERQQLRWVATGAAIALIGLTVPLWDLDRLVSRTVTSAVVTALLVVPYLLLVPAATRRVQGSGSLAVADQTMQPTRASLWLRSPAGSRQVPLGG